MDFTSLDEKISLDEIKSVLEGEDFLEIRKDFVSRTTIKIERLKYAGPLALPNSLKLEIDYGQNVVLPFRNLNYNNVWKVDAKVNVMDIREICAEKIRAASDRARYRDFYDLFLIFDNIKIDINQIYALIRQKEIRKPISQDNIFKNWYIAKQEKQKEIERIYYSKEVTDTAIESMIEKLKMEKIINLDKL